MMSFHQGEFIGDCQFFLSTFSAHFFFFFLMVFIDMLLSNPKHMVNLDSRIGNPA
jgi:hypothetical protein